MKTPSRGQRQRRQRIYWKRLLKSLLSHPIPWLWMVAALIIFAVAGLILAAFPVPDWVWAVAFAAILMQAIALAGPVALARFRWLPANLLALLGILGAGTMAVALGIALNYTGTANLDEIDPGKTSFEVIRMSLLAMAIAALGASLLATVGDRLIKASFRRRSTTIIVSATAILGMGIGGSLGLLLLRTTP